MKSDIVTARVEIGAPRSDLFDLLVDPSTHAAIDGTGWVRGPRDDAPLDHVGQVFRMAMHHEDHPDKNYETVNLVEVFDRPSAIAWKPGYDSPDTGELEFGGWTWRYDLVPSGPATTEVTLTYDWSAVPDDIREYLDFPPFDDQHLGNSLEHLARLATQGRDAD